MLRPMTGPLENDIKTDGKVTEQQFIRPRTKHQRASPAKRCSPYIRSLSNYVKVDIPFVHSENQMADCSIKAMNVD